MCTDALLALRDPESVGISTAGQYFDIVTLCPLYEKVVYAELLDAVVNSPLVGEDTVVGLGESHGTGLSAACGASHRRGSHGGSEESTIWTNRDCHVRGQSHWQYGSYRESTRRVCLSVIINRKLIKQRA